MNQTSRNSTSDRPIVFRYQWGIVPILETVLFPCIVILNGFILGLFLKNKRLTVPFNIYLTSVLTSNLAFALLNDPLDILSFISPYWWLGDTWCTAYLYAINVLSGIVMHSHILITINRVWAVTFPHSYRKHHSVGKALLFVSFTWMYVHIVSLPGVLMDAFLYRLPTATNGCIINTSELSSWSVIEQFMIFALPNVTIICAYPYMLYMRRDQRKVADSKHFEKRRGVSLQSVNNNKAPRNAPTFSSNTSVRRTLSKENRAFLIFTTLTLSMTICWTPLETYYTIWCFVDLSSFTTVLQLCEVLFIVQPVLDPVFFAIIMPGIRYDVVECFRKYRLR